ncbi:MAG: LPS assembly protein LptD, partial [Alphaproteobacteria bacterium]|nr:LPS assembly protein LptD [Alphaproteobacteria bacterium]
ETGRLSIKGNWHKNVITDLGHLFGLAFTLRQDVYFTRGYNKHHVTYESDPMLYAQQRNNNKTTGRFFPQAAANWQYPLISYQEDYSYLIEPKVMCVVGTRSQGSRFIPNNDARTFTLDDTSLFLPNRYDGFDRIDSGSRVIGGVEQKIERSNAEPLFRSISWFFGQSRRLDSKQVLEHTYMGENNRYSDFVNRIKIEPYRHVFLRLRNAVDVRTRRQRFMEIGSLIGEPVAQLDIGYVKMARQCDITKTALSQLNWQVSSKINDTWSLSYGEVRNFLRNTTGPLNQYASVAWENDCFKVETGLHKTRVQVLDLEPSTGILFVVTFKNLGSFTPSNTSRYPKSILSQF